MNPSLSSQTCPSTLPYSTPCASLTPDELAAFDIGPSRTPANYDNDNDDEEAANDDEEMEDDE
jgi:hypothetical protein